MSHSRKKPVIGTEKTTKIIAIQLDITYSVDVPVFTITSKTSDGFFKDEIEAIIHYFENLIKESEAVFD